MCKTVTLFCILLQLQTFAQGKNDYQWVTGYGAYGPHQGGLKIDFNAVQPGLTHFSFPAHFGLNTPCSISDDSGNLQFYSNGCQILNAQNEVIENGLDLSPGAFQSIVCDNYPYAYDSYQNMMIVPRPGHPGQYVYFHHTIETDEVSGKILYTLVDMNANNGKGKVRDKNLLLRGPVLRESAFTAAKHANGRDWWIIIPEANANIYNLYLLNPDTILGPFTQHWENSEAAQFPKTGCNIMVSPDEKKLAHVTLSAGFNRIFLYDFDRGTGALSNPKIINATDPNAYSSWATFSPNSRFLYFQIAQKRLYQYDLTAPDLEASAILVGEYDGFVTPQGASGAFNSMALAPNNKIYMCCTSGTYYYHTIHAPDEPGAACDFRQHDLELPAATTAQMPNYPNFRLGPLDGSVYDTLGLDNKPVALFRWEANQPFTPQLIKFTDLSYYEPSIWFWDFGDPVTEGANISQFQNPEHHYSAPGAYTVCLTVCNGSTCDTGCKEVEIYATNIKNAIAQTDGISISPNPVAGMLQIQAELPVSGTVILSDITGRKLQSISFDQKVKRMEIPVDQLGAGVYLVSFLDNSGRVGFSGRFVVIR